MKLSISSHTVLLMDGLYEATLRQQNAEKDICKIKAVSWSNNWGDGKDRLVDAILQYACCPSYENPPPAGFVQWPYSNVCIHRNH